MTFLIYIFKFVHVLINAIVLLYLYACLQRTRRTVQHTVHSEIFAKILCGIALEDVYDVFDVKIRDYDLI